MGILAEEFDDVENQSEDEGLDDYKKGGYHPVCVGEIFIGRYVALQKLGWGHFSTVWLCKDTKYETYVAIKVQKSANHYLEAAFDEVEILQKVAKHSMDKDWLDELARLSPGSKHEFGRDDCHVVQLLNAFIHQGPYGKHFCMVFEVLGVNLLEIIKRYEYKGIPLPLCRRITRQILLGLHYLHNFCGIIDTDLKPENVLICLGKKELQAIHDRGSLDRSAKIKKRTLAIRKRIAELNGQSEEIEPSLPDQKDDSLDSELSDHEIKNSDLPIQSGKDSIQNKPDSEFITRELERLSREKNLGKKERKNLKKKLKRKLKASGQGVLEKTEWEAGEEELARSGLAPDFRIKIADLGNGCWKHHHFQPEIQTRQYRSPETILCASYNETADIWSLGCMIFEILTGEFLFDPKKNEGVRKSEDHLGLMMQILDKFPRSFSTVGSLSRHYVNIQGKLINIHENLNFLSMQELFVKMHRIKKNEAEALADFLTPMLRPSPRERASAAQMLEHHWLQMTSSHLFASDEEIRLNPEIFDRVNLDNAPFHQVTDPQDFECDNSFLDSDQDESGDSETEIDSFYSRETKCFDRNFKNVYVGYADGIDLNALDNTANWQFDKKVSG